MPKLQTYHTQQTLEEMPVHGKFVPVGAAPEAGFTLLEVLVVIAIIGLLIGLVAPAALRQLGGGRVSWQQLKWDDLQPLGLTTKASLPKHDLERRDV